MPSRGPSEVVPQHPTRPLPVDDLTSGGTARLTGIDQRQVRVRSFIAIAVLVGMLVLATSRSGSAQNPPSKMSEPELRKLAEANEKARAQLAKARRELLEKELELAHRQLELLRKANVGKDALAAFEAIVEVKTAELQLQRASEKARSLLNGAKLVDADGTMGTPCCTSACRRRGAHPDRGRGGEGRRDFSVTPGAGGSETG
jgi:hypothetical protein